jgi:ketosteroid isomerase-like protein
LKKTLLKPVNLKTNIMKTKNKMIIKKICSVAAGLLLVTLLNSCNDKTAKVDEISPKTEFNLDTAKIEIEEANANFMALVAAGDSIGLANAYTIDAKFMGAGAPSVIGRKDIQTAMAGIVNAGITKVDLKLEHIYGTEDLIAEEGKLTLYAGDIAVAEEKYIVLWKKEDGKWKLFRDIFNSNVPVE